MADLHGTTINYEPLQKEVTFSEGVKFKAKRGKLPFAAWAGIGLGVLMAFYFVSNGSWVGIGILLLIAFAGYVVYVNGKKKEVRFKAFADANGFEYISMGEPGAAETGSIFEGGHSKHAKRIVSGNYHNLPFWFGTYIYSTGVAQNSRTKKVGVMSVQLPYTFPHMLIDGGLQALASAKAYNNFVRYENVDSTFAQVYTVYYPQGQEHVLQTIITPQLMHAMRNLVQRKVDLEIKGDRLYIYTGLMVDPNEKTLKTLFTILENINFQQ